MNVLIILAHPNKESFNHAIAKTCRDRLMANGHTVVFHDLHDEGFDPIITSGEIPKYAPVNEIIQKHCDELMASNGIIIIHPNWWGQPPAILKGWIDRVIRPGITYEFKEGDNGEGVPKGLLKAKKAIVFNTSNTGTERENDVFKDPLETIWRNCIFDFCGIKDFHRRVFRIMVTSDRLQRQNWLAEVEHLMDKHFEKKENDTRNEEE
jgi:NAD(P)H dehydrogenase (quinone)